MTRIQKVLAAMLFLATAVSLNAQTFTKPLNQGYWTLGLNGGTAYQSSDVNSTSNGLGLGITVGKNIYHRPGAALDFGIQGRLGYTKSTGLNTVRNFNISNNDAVNGSENLNYESFPEKLGVNQGFIFSNHKTSSLEGALEAVVTLNELKEKTGVKVSLYGGFGANYFNVETDQAGADGKEYFNEYAELNDRAPSSLIKKNLREAILDGEYESYADGFTNGLGKMKLMPSLGIEAGLQVTPKFSIDLGHRTTFSGTDLLDGEQWIDGDQDILHYTYLGTTFNFNKREKRFLPPVISVYEPRNASLTNYREAKVYAKIENAESSADVQLLINGQARPFRFKKEKLSADILLQEGENEIIITANTLGGEDRVLISTFFEKKKVVTPPIVIVPSPPVIHTPPTVHRPVVEFIGIRNNIRIREDRIRIDAIVKNVIAKRDIILFVNGREFDFRFDPRRERVDATIHLFPGENEVVMKAFNQGGETAERMIIFFEERIPEPFVRITQPSRNFTTRKNEVKVVAETEFIADRRDILVTANGREIFNVDFANNCLTAFARLKRGKNIIRIRVENQSGIAVDEVIVFHNEGRTELREPTVNIISPTDHETVNKKSIELTAEIFEVARKRDIELLLNDIEIRNFNFRNNRLTANLELKKGSNEIILRAANQDGRDEQVLIVKFKKKKAENLPVINIISPTNNLTTDKSTVEVIAEIKHSQNAEIFVNGKEVSESGVVNGKVKKVVKLTRGRNIIKVTAENSTGTFEKQVIVVFKRRETVVTIKKPFVQITSPTEGTVTNERFAKLEATLERVDKITNVDVFLNDEKLRNVILKRKKLTAMLAFAKGENTIKIIAKNKGGKSTEIRTVIYRDKVQTPIKNDEVTKTTEPNPIITAPIKNDTKKDSSPKTEKIETPKPGKTIRTQRKGRS